MKDKTPLFARQAIYNHKQEVVAYELLFRSANSGNAAGKIDGDQATAKVLLKGFGEHSFEELTGGLKAFVNFTRKLLLDPPRLPKNKLVIEVLEDITPDSEVLTALDKLKSRGYKIALDDFLLNNETQKFVPFADYIKVDVLNMQKKELESHTKKLKTHNKILIAEKIEDHETMQYCIDLGFKYFQGYFLCKPEIVTGVNISESKQLVLKLINQVNDPEVEIDDIVRTIATDPALSYKVLRLINSSAMGLPRKIESLNQAVTMLGITAIRNWATFLLLANDDSKPKELCVITMCRAKFCEALGTEIGGRQLGDACFTVGILSNIDAFINMSMQEVLKRLNLATTIEDALLNKQGELGKILEVVVAYERGHWAKVDWAFLRSQGMQANQANMLYGNSIIWATQMVGMTV